MEDLTLSTSDYKRVVLADCMANGASEDFLEWVIEGIDRIETKLPSLKNRDEMTEALSLYIYKCELKKEVKDEIALRYDERNNNHARMEEVMNMLERMGQLGTEIGEAYKAQVETSKQLRETLELQEKIVLN